MKSVLILFFLTLCSLAYGYPPCPSCPPCPPPPPPPVPRCRKPEIIWTGDACGCSSTLPYHVEVPPPIELAIPKRELGYQLAFVPETVDCKRYIFDYEVEVPVAPPPPPKLRDCGYILDIPPPPPPERRYRLDYEVEVPCTCSCKPQYYDLSGHIDRIVLPKPDCCIVADGDCPCNRYKPHIEPLTDCILAPPPPPKPVKKCKKPKRVECFCEEVDYPRYESICRHKRSNEPNESTSSSEEDSNSSMDSDEEIQVKESLVSDKNAITVEQIKNCKISNEYGIKNVTNDQSNYYINDKPYFRKYYEPKNVEYLDDGSKIMYDYLGHKYIEKNGRKKIIKPAFYLEEEIRISEVTATKPIASADTNSTKISIENPSMNSAVTIKTDNKDVDAMDDLSKNLGSILSLLVQDKHNDLADALGDVLMGMAELEDMKTTLEEDLKTKKKEIKNKIAVETKLPAPSDISIPVNNKRLTSSDGPNLPFDKMIPTPLNRLPLSNANKLVPPIDKSHFAVENKAPLLERWIMQKENHQAAPAPELQIMFENKRPQPSTFDQLPVKEVKVPDKLQTNIKENLLGKLPETGRASSADKLYTKLTETPKLIFPLNEKQDEKNKNFIPIQKQIGLPNKNINAKINNIKPIPLQVNENLKTPYVPPKVMDDAFHQTENNKAFADNIRQEAKLIDVPIKFSPFNEIISDERNKNIVSINKEANQPDSNSNVNDGQVISLQTNENQKMPYAPFNIIDNRFRTLKPTQNNFKQYYQPVQQYPLKHVLSNNIEELNI